jgi:hypothetical protein
MSPSGCPSGVTIVILPAALSWKYFKNAGFSGATLPAGPPAKATPAETARKSPIVRIRINFMILLGQAIFCSPFVSLERQAGY